MHTVRVWDLPTRLFHWVLVVCVTGSFVTGMIGGDAMQWHFRFGYAVASLLLFRVVWGFVGGRWSRFSTFLFSPRSAVAYLRGRSPREHSVGHNPLGAWSVFAMLLLLAIQVATGLFSEDKGDALGPLSAFVTHSTVRAVTGYHKNIGQVLLLGLVVLHLCAVAYHLFVQKDNLVIPMIKGDKSLMQPVAGSVDDSVRRWLAVGILALCSGAVAWVVHLGN